MHYHHTFYIICSTLLIDCLAFQNYRKNMKYVHWHIPVSVLITTNVDGYVEF